MRRFVASVDQLNLTPRALLGPEYCIMRQRRRGFTLVEILVALALTIFILSILAQVFVTGADTFRTLKSVGDLNASLRTATTILRNDLSADHFEGKRRLSDAAYWTQGPPDMGYFFLDQRNTGSIAQEGVDANLIPLRRVTGYTMAMTVKAKGTRPENFFTAGDPNGLFANFGNPTGRYQTQGLFTSQWIEVGYFLKPIGAAADGTPLFALYRQQRIVVGDPSSLNFGAGRIGVTAALTATYTPLYSCTANPTAPGFYYFNSPADLTIPERRTAANFTASPATFTVLSSNGVPTGNDLLLTDVLSFDIQVLTRTTTGTTPATAALATDTTFGDLPAPSYYDTWSRRHDDAYDYSARTTGIGGNPYVKQIPMAPQPAAGNVTPVPTYRILALQITLRIWDPRTKLARQISIIQDM